MKLTNKKAIALSQLPAAVIIIVIIGVVAVVGTTINDRLKAGESAGSDVNQTASNASLGIIEITQNMQLLGLIVVMGAVIAILLASFGGFIGQAGGL